MKAGTGHWLLEVHDRNDTLLTRKEGIMDPFQTLIQSKDPSVRGQARVSAIYGTQYNFGEHKVSINIQVACDQTAETIDKAAELVFIRAVDLTEKGMQMVIDATAKQLEKTPK